QLGDGGHRVLGVGQHVAGGADQVGVDHAGAAAHTAAGPSGGQPFVGAGHDELSDQLGQGGEDVEDQAPAGGGGVELLVQGGEPDLAGAQVGDHGHQVLEGTAVAVQGGHDQGVAGVEEGVARLQLGALVGAPGLGVGEDAAASGRGERVHPAVPL